jgi:hypothetical protein
VDKCSSRPGAALYGEVKLRLARFQRYKFNFYGPAVCAVEFLECKVAVSRMGFDDSLHYRPAALGAQVVEIKSQRHRGCPFALGE